MSSKNVRQWRRGLLGALVNQMAGVVPLLIVDPIQFNPFDGGWQNVVRFVSVVALSGILGAALYLKQHPLPECDDDAPATPIGV